MAVRPTKATSARSISKPVIKAVRLAPALAKAATKKTVTSVDQAATSAAKVATAVKKRMGKSSNATPPAPRSRAETAATAVEPATRAPKTAVKQAVKLMDIASHGAANAGESVTAMAARSTKSPGPHARSKATAKATARASVPLKPAVKRAASVVEETRRGATALTDSAKTETAFAIDTYQYAATETIDSAEEIVKAANDVIAGATEIHRMIWASMQRSLQTAVEMPAQLATCTSFADLAQTQRDWMRRGFSEWLNISQEILMANRRIADRAIHAVELR